MAVGFGGEEVRLASGGGGSWLGGWKGEMGG